MLNFSSILRPTSLALHSPLSPFVAPRGVSGSLQQVRFRGQLAPRKTKYKKAAKGAPGTQVPTGGSIKASTLHHGTFGLRATSSVRITAAQLTSCQAAVRRRIKPIKGAEFFLRVFPDIPVCVKGNEQRMGKGKGSFEYWSCRVRPGRVIMEVGGGDIREEIAKAALKLAQARLPLQTEFISLSSYPRLGRISSAELLPPPAAQPVPNGIAYLESRQEGSAWKKVVAREADKMKDIIAGLQGVSFGAQAGAKGIGA